MEQKVDLFELIQGIFLKFRQATLQEISSTIKNLEEEFDKTISRKNWYVHDRRERRLWTPKGDLIINRRIYLNRHTLEYKILFDDFLGLDPYLYVQKSFWNHLLTSLKDVRSFTGLANIFGQDFSTTTISKMLAKTNFYIITKRIAIETPVVFVNLDGMYVNQNRKSRHEMKFACSYTESVGTKRKDLKNRVILPFKSDLNPDEIAELLNVYLEKIYGKIAKIYIVGDGARWIDTVASYFDNAVRLIDKFHYKKWIKDLAGRKVKINWGLVEGDEKLFHSYLVALAANEITGEISEQQIKEIKRIMKFRKSFLKCKELGLINVIEGIQSHYVASFLKNRRAFSKHNAFKILMINLAHHNDWKLTNDPNLGINLDDFNSHDVRINLSIFEEQMSNVPNVNHHRPITAEFFRNICHGKW